MVFVFGLNVPLLEMLVVFLILLGLGLVIILVELKRLRQLLTEERSVVAQFEKDLVRFEDDEDKSPSERLQSYIKDALARGIPKDQLQEVLRKRGWDQQKIDQYLNEESDRSAKSATKSTK
jgi:tRNA pseudouridine-54 N-methylase